MREAVVYGNRFLSSGVTRRCPPPKAWGPLVSNYTARLPLPQIARFCLQNARVRCASTGHVSGFEP